jgi:sec-independent protein translocase protein TatA
MPNVGPTEIIVVLALVLIIFGPKRLPELGHSLGKGIREFRSSISSENDDEPKPRALDTGDTAGTPPTTPAATPTSAAGGEQKPSETSSGS